MAKKKANNTISGPSAVDEARWRAESDLRTLIEARKIKQDSARYKAATDLATQQLKDVAAVAGDGDADE